MASEPLSKRIKPVLFKRKTYQNEGSHIYGTLPSRLFLAGYFLGKGFCNIEVRHPGMTLWVRDATDEDLIEAVNLFNGMIHGKAPFDGFRYTE